MIFRSVKTKATLILTSGFVALLVLVSALEMYRVKTDLRRVLAEQQLTLVARVAGEIDEKLKSAHGALIAVAKVIPPEIAQHPARLRSNLENRPGVQSLFDGLFVFSPKGIVLVDLPAIGAAGRSVTDREYFQETVTSRKPVISRPYIARVVKEPAIMLTAPVLDRRGEVVAILGATLNLLKPNFLGKIGAAKVGKTGQFALIGRDRTIIVSHDRARIMTPGPAPGVSTYFDRAVAGAGGWEENINSRGLHALFSYSPLETVPWVLVGALPVEEAYAPIVTAQKRIAGITVALVALLVPIVWLGTGHFIAPVVALRDAIRRIHDDPGPTREVSVRSRDEIGDLAADFNALMRERNDAAAALRDSAHRLTVIADNMPALISYVDSGERYRYANETYSDWFRVAPGAILGRTVREVMGEGGYAARASYVREALAGTEAVFELPITMDGVERFLQVRYVPDLRDDGRVAGFYILASDITELKRTESLLRESEQRLTLALEGSQLALFDWDIVTGEVFLSEQWAVMLGRKRETVRTTFAALEALVHPDDQAAVGAAIRDALGGATAHYRAEHRVRTDGGKWIWIQSNGQVTARDPEGRALRLLGTNADVTERKRVEHELAESRAILEHAALHDSLTGLPNRSALNDRLDHALVRARRNRQLVAALCLDLDRFKEINDTMGHTAGDAVLKEFSARLNQCLRASDTAARMGGDEFVVLLEDLRRPDDARAIADKILHAMREEFRGGSMSLLVTASIGIAFTGGVATGEELLRQADAALYEAKRAGRNTFRVAPSTLEVIRDSGAVAGRPERPERDRTV